MNNRQLIVQALDHIEANLRVPLSVQALSRNTGYSLYHFIRLFQGVTGLTPGDYISRRKITEAAKDILKTPERSLQDISLDYAFNDYETFARAFKRILRRPPSALRQKLHPDIPPLLPRLYENDLQQWPDTLFVQPRLIDLGELVLQGPQVNEYTNPAAFGAAWENLFGSLALLPERMLPERYYQLGYWADDYEDSGASFLCACELSRIHPVSSGPGSGLVADQAIPQFPVHVLPPARYLKFLHKGRSREIPATYKYIYGVYLPKTNYRLTLPYEFEFYGDDYLGPDHPESVSEIYIPLTLL
ncbi:helix-turn-helix domain-containing protein [Paenibacillus tepidiphilus]|uniref:helix-turn-helix domain-containing protein n=1 Tax=Paenibacillus tepidiphilus TaxID=2608683 RepID=UPI00123A6E72|nr:helix-turn-helix domain-containing protein [Paenibacillus tepidiphilus]